MTSTAGRAGRAGNFQSGLVLSPASRLPLLCQGAATNTKQVRHVMFWSLAGTSVIHTHTFIIWSDPGMTHLILVPLTRQASYEQLVGAVLHHRPHNLKLVQVNDRVWLCEAQCDSNVVVIVVGPTYLHHHMQLLVQ